MNLLLFLLIPLIVTCALIKSDKELNYPEAVEFCGEKNGEIIEVHHIYGQFWIESDLGSDICNSILVDKSGYFFKKSSCSEKFLVFCSTDQVPSSKNKFFQIFDTPKTHKEAFEHCSSLRGNRLISRLVTIDSIKLNDFLLMRLMLSNVTQNKFWTDVSFISSSRLSAGGSLYENFHPLEKPFGLSSCVTLTFVSDGRTDPGDWSIHSCEEKFGYICEIDHFTVSPDKEPIISKLKEKGKCRDGYHMLNDKCYKLIGSENLDFSSNRSASSFTDKIEAECTKDESHLARIESSLELAYLRVLSRIYFQNVTIFWVDGKYQNHKHQFVFSDSYKPYTRSISENRVLMNVLGKPEYSCFYLDRNEKYLHLSQCNLKNQISGYICEYSLDDSKSPSVETSSIPKGQYCPQNWSLFQGNCYSKPIRNDSKNFIKARSNCLNTLNPKLFPHSADLLSLGSKEEELFVVNLLNSTHPAHANIWLGLFFTISQENKPRRWFWMDGANINYTNFALGEPKDLKSSGVMTLRLSDDLKSSSWYASPYQVETDISTICKVPSFSEQPTTIQSTSNKSYCNEDNSFCFSVIPSPYGLLRNKDSADNVCHSFMNDSHYELLVLEDKTQETFVVETLKGLTSVQDDLFLTGNIFHHGSIHAHGEALDGDLSIDYESFDFASKCLSINASKATTDTTKGNSTFSLQNCNRYLPLLCGYNRNKLIAKNNQVLVCPDNFVLIQKECIFISPENETVMYDDFRKKCQEINPKAEPMHSESHLHNVFLTLSMIGTNHTSEFWIHGSIPCSIFPSRKTVDCSQRHRYTCLLTSSLADKTSIVNNNDKLVKMIGISSSSSECPDGFIYFSPTQSCYNIVDVGKEKIINHETCKKAYPTVKDIQLTSLSGPSLELYLANLLVINRLHQNHPYLIFVDKTKLIRDGWMKDNLISSLNITTLGRLLKNPSDILSVNDLVITSKYQLDLVNFTRRIETNYSQYGLCSLVGKHYSYSKNNSSSSHTNYSLRKPKANEYCPVGSVIFRNATCIYKSAQCSITGLLSPPNEPNFDSSLFYKNIIDTLRLDGLYKFGLKVEYYDNTLMLSWGNNMESLSFREIQTNSNDLVRPVYLNAYIGHLPNDENIFHIKNSLPRFNEEICQTPIQYFGSDGLITESKELTFHEASENCLSMTPAGNLAQIHSERDLEMLTKALPEKGAWIGLNSLKGYLTWLDQRNVDYLPEFKASPTTGNDEICFIIKKDVGQKTLLVPTGCNEKYPSICSLVEENSPINYLEEYHEKNLICPDGYFIFGQKCYKIFYTQASWSEAQASCSNESTSTSRVYLASPVNIQENDFVQSLLFKVKSMRTSHSGYPSVWIYTNNTSTAHDILFDWSFLKKMLTFFSSRQVYPTSNGNCISMLRSMKYEVNGRWFIEPCNNRLDGFICEQKAFESNQAPKTICDNGDIKHPVKNICYKFLPTEVNINEGKKVMLPRLNDPFDAAFLRAIMFLHDYNAVKLSLAVKMYEKTTWTWDDSHPVRYTDWTLPPSLDKNAIFYFYRNPYHLNGFKNMKAETYASKLDSLLGHLYEYEPKIKDELIIPDYLDRSKCSVSWMKPWYGNLTQNYLSHFKDPIDMGQLNQVAKDGRNCQRWDLNINSRINDENYIILASEMVGGESYLSYAENYCSYLIPRSTSNPQDDRIVKYGCMIDFKFVECEFKPCLLVKGTSSPLKTKSHSPVAISFLIFFLFAILAGLVYLFVKKRKTSNILYSRQLDFGSPSAFDGPFHAADGWNNDLNSHDQTMSTGPIADQSDDQLLTNAGGSLFFKGINPFQSNPGYQRVEDDRWDQPNKAY